MKCDICKKQIEQDLIGTPVCKAVCLDCFKSYNSNNGKELKNHLKTLEKDIIIELYLQMRFERDFWQNDKTNETHIIELEEQNKHKSELGLALYTALYEHLGNHGVIDNVPSAIDQLVGKDCGEYADIYNEYKNQQKELALYKKALQLACYYMEYEYPKKNDDIYYRKEQELEMIFLQQAKEKIDEEKSNNCSC